MRQRRREANAKAGRSQLTGSERPPQRNVLTLKLVLLLILGLLCRRATLKKYNIHFNDLTDQKGPSISPVAFS